jgi:tRNA (guanine-N7-)-methyltransferase
MIDQKGLRNIRLYDRDATELLDWLPDGSLDGIDLLYPDPWPKRRHWKRRFVNEENLDRFFRLLKEGGAFRFASDIDHYVNWTLRHFMSHPGFEWLADGPNDWREPFAHWQSTRYEQKAIKAGRQPAYLRFRKKEADPDAAGKR